jgi:hypothetical protein
LYFLGKSTFINYLTNYFRAGTYDSPRIAIPTRYYTKITESFGHCEKAIDDVTISKTDACHQYLFHDSKTDKQYLFLDTPGLGDTRGAQQDQTNIETILNAINNLQGLTGVIIVVNGSMARITTNFKSVLLGLRGNLPDIVMDHVVVILSHVKRHQSTFDIKKTLKMNGTTVYPYYMQNSAFAQDPKKWGAHEHEYIECDWAESMEEISLMLSIINTFQTKSVAAFDDMRTIRNAIKTCMHDARLEITNVQQMHDQILAYEQVLYASEYCIGFSLSIFLSFNRQYKNIRAMRFPIEITHKNKQS